MGVLVFNYHSHFLLSLLYLNFTFSGKILFSSRYFDCRQIFVIQRSEVNGEGPFRLNTTGILGTTTKDGSRLLVGVKRFDLDKLNRLINISLPLFLVDFSFVGNSERNKKW